MTTNEGTPKSQRLIVSIGLLVVAAAVCLWAVINRSVIEGRQVAQSAETDNDTSVQASTDEKPSSRKDDKAKAEDDPYAEQRKAMVQRQLAARDIKNHRVLAAMGRVPRHEFVPDDLRGRAYVDRPLPIGNKQTISQPYIVALMTQLADPKPKSRVLDIGTGSGYQAAVLAELVEKVHSIEIVRPLADSARKRLKKLGYKNIEVIHGDGYRGLPKKAPFDVIIVAAAPDHVPQPLVEQLAPGGRLVIPVGSFFQNLLVIEKQKDGTIHRENVAPVAFVPMTGEARKKMK